MPEPIRYETKSDRELLIVVAEAINSLNEKTEKLVAKAVELESYANNNRERIAGHDLIIARLMSEQAAVTKQSTDTLSDLYTIMRSQAKEINAFAPVSKAFWWVVGVVGAALIALLTAMFKHVFPS